MENLPIGTQPKCVQTPNITNLNVSVQEPQFDAWEGVGGGLTTLVVELDHRPSGGLAMS